MIEFKVTMQQAPGISDEERRRRLHQAYEILFSAARRTRERKATKEVTKGASADDD